MTGQRDDPAVEAARWYARLHSSDATSKDHLAFARWEAASLDHAHAWRAMVQTAHASADLRADRPGPYRRPGLQRWLRHRGLPVAAVVVAVLVIGVSLIVMRDEGAATSPSDDRAGRLHATTTEGPRDIRLDDGTVMTLDAQSTARVFPVGAVRRVSVERGQAFFAVVRDKVRPFIVSAGGNSVTALGTRFAVRIAPMQLAVHLVDGSVRVDMPVIGRAITLSPGNRLSLQGHTLRVVATGAAQATGWRQGRLTFDTTPPGEVVADLDRYTTQRITLATPGLATHPFSGVPNIRGGGMAPVAALGASGIARPSRIDSTRIVLAAP